MGRRRGVLIGATVVAALVLGALAVQAGPWASPDRARPATDAPSAGGAPTASGPTASPSAPPVAATASFAPPAALTAALRSAVRDGSQARAFRPRLADAQADWPVVWLNGCQAAHEVTESPPCEYGAPDGERTVVIFGDSHAGQLFAALEPAARAAGWRLVSWTKAACPMADLPVRSKTLKREYRECAQWRASTARRIVRMRPDLVVTSQYEDGQPPEVSPRRFAVSTLRALAPLRDAGIPLVYVEDTPTPGVDAVACVRANRDDVRRCAFPSDRAYADPERHRVLSEELRSRDVEVVPLRRWYCASGECPAVVGDTLVYRDDDHVTKTYVAQRLRPLGDALLARAGG